MSVPHEITVQWDPSPAPVSGYNVYRGTSSGNESKTPINTSLVTTTSFLDNTVYPGVIYFYEITAVLNGVESLDSVQVTSTPVPFNPAPANVDLGLALSFSVLGASTVTNVPGSATRINGDVGVSPGTSITGFGAPTTVGGVFHPGDFVSAAAQGALTAAFNDAMSRTGAITLTGDVGGQTLLPGVYTSASSLGITGNLVLDAQGDPNAVWIFQIGSTLTTATTNSAVVLVGGAEAANVYWAVGSSATLGIGTAIAGNIMAEVSITANTGASVNGRLLARTGAITLDGNGVIVYLPCDLHALPASPPNLPPAPPAAP